MLYENIISSLGWQLPENPFAIASYVAARQVDKLVYTSGQLPLQQGKILLTGKVGQKISITETKNAAIMACLNGLAAIKSICSDLQQIQQIMRLVVYVQSEADFHEQHLVANHASDFLVDVFGEKGVHCRSAVGVHSLPLNSVLELELMVQLQ